MNIDAFMGLVNNAGLLLALTVLYDVLPLQKNRSQRAREILTGIFIGLIGMALMLTPRRYSDGVVFDTRSILLSLSGFFFGVIPTLIAALMTSALRIAHGGSGGLMGVSVILTSAGLGLIWRYFHGPKQKTLRWIDFYGFGLIVHLAMLLWAIVLPHEIAFDVLGKVSLPVMLIFPLGTVLLGLLLHRQRQRNETELARDLMARISETSMDAIFLTSPDGSINAANPAACRMFGYSEEEFIGMARRHY